MPGMILHQDAWQRLFQMLLKRDPTPLAWLACARGGSPPPCCSCKQLNISRQSEELSRKAMSIWKFGSFFPWKRAPQPCQNIMLRGPEGLVSFLQWEYFQTKQVSQILNRWDCLFRKNERMLFNMSDFLLFKNFMWTSAISCCYQIVIYPIHSFSNDRRM